MKIKFTKLTILTVLMCLVLSVVSSATYGDQPYASYYIVENGGAPIQSPYEVVTVIDFKTTEEGRLNAPEDIFIGQDDKIYVADTRNNRIVIINPVNEYGQYTLNNIIQGTSTYEEGDMSALKEPTGIYVDEDGTILVADKGNGRLVEYTEHGNFRYSYSTPESTLLSEDFKYMPLKVVKDNRGYIYVANSSDSNGIVMLDDDGSFRQYYGANKVVLSFWDSIARLLWNREDRLGTVVTLPYSFNNIYASADGYIYATTTTATPPQVRKINAGGTDVVYASTDFTDSMMFYYDTSVSQIFCDVTVDNNNNMLIVDQQFGRVYEYNEGGVNLFTFATRGSGYGQFSLPSGIEVDNQGRLYVLDKNSSTITVFQPTEFASLIHQANSLYSLGKYDEAFPVWQQVMDKNSYYTLALQNMGSIYMRQEKYEEALDYFEDAMDATLASSAFKEIRADFLLENFSIIATVVVGVLVLWVVYLNIRSYRRRKYGVPPEKQTFFTPVKHFWRRLKGVIRHPVDTFEAIRYENQGSYKDAFIIMLIYMIVTVGSEYTLSFIYRGGMPLEFINMESLILIALLPWIVVCVVNYAVTTIMYGEGRFRDVIIGGAYCHVPLMLVTLPLSLLTHVLTLDEQNLFNMSHTILYIWTGILVYLCIKCIHGFHPVKGVVVFFITVVGVAAVVILFLIVYGLAEQMFGFIFQFGKELSYLV